MRRNQQQKAHYRVPRKRGPQSVIHTLHKDMIAIYRATHRLIASCILLSASVAYATDPRTEDTVRQHGCFRFPQSKAQCLCDSSELRVSAWNNKSLLYVQAILWNDNSMKIGTTDEGRQFGDSSTLSLDIDANQKVSRNTDRNYSLNPGLSMNGLYYSIRLGRCSSTSIKDDSYGTGSICYVNLAGGRKIRVDNYVIPLAEIGRSLHDDIRLCYLAHSSVPSFEINSVGDTNRPPPGGCYHIPLASYHRIILDKGSPVEQEAIAASWSIDSPHFERTYARTNSNERWFSSSYVHVDSGFERLKLSHNTAETIRQELAHDQFLSEMGDALHLPSNDVARLRFSYNSEYKWFELEQNGTRPFIFDSVRKAIDSYAKERSAGHTRQFMLAAVSQQESNSTSDDPGRNAIADYRPLIPVSWLQKGESGSVTNKAGELASRTFTTTVINGNTVTNEVVNIPKADEICRWTSYHLVDGEICWRYFVQYKADGSVDYIHSSRMDSKELDPKYTDVLVQVEAEVTAEMKQDGTHRQFGSCHSFWIRKKEKLNERGIIWRSPAELNPNTCYD